MAGILGDEISRQMDADLFGSPRKSSLDPKVSGEMDKDLGLVPSRPWAGAIKPPEPEEPGYLGALGKGIYTGFRRRLPEMTGQAIQFTGAAPEAGKAITEWAREGEERPQFKSGIKQALYEGGEMLAPSVAIPAALAVAGVGVLPASVATAAIFGLSQAQSTKEEAEKRGVEPGAAPYATGAIEALGETAGTAALGRLLGPLAPILTRGGKVAVKDVIKPTVSRLLKEFPRTMAIEGGTEFGQQFGQALVEKGAGIRPEAEPLSEGLSTLGPTAVLTGLTMGMAIPSQRLRARSVEKSLEDEMIAPENRRAAADYVASYMAEADEGFAKRWRVRADQAITKGEKIPVDQDIYEWLGETPKEAAPEAQKEAIPSQPNGYDLIAKKPAEPEIPPAASESPAASQPPAGPVQPAAPASAILEPEKPAAKTPLPEAAKESRDLLQEAPPPVEPGGAITQVQEGTKFPAAEQEKKKAERRESKGYFPAEKLWDRTVGEVQDEWSAFMADYEDIKAKTEKELEPLRKELESLKGKRDKFSTAKKKEIQKEIGQKEEIYKSIPAQAESDYLDETQKFAGMVEEEARKRGIPEERIPDFVTDFQIYSSNERPYIESNYNLSHREIFDELAQEYLVPEEKQQSNAAVPAAAIPGAPKEPWEIPKKDFIQTQPVESLRSQPGTDKPQFWEGYHAEAVRNALQKGKPVPAEVLKDYPELRPAKAIPEKIEAAAGEAATSPANKLPEPTEAQKEAGNYKKGHVNLHGLDISIENPRGSTRSGVSPEGKKWETPLAHHYGYIRGTKGKDKDHLDVFIGPYPDSEFVTVIDQVDPKTGKFDEHKVMIGFRDMASAQVGYLANYEPGWKGLGAAKGLDILEFKDWLKEGDTAKPIGLESGGRPAPQGAISSAERRKDPEKRKRISEMTPEEMKKELLTDPLTGLGNRRAYDESPRMPIQAMIDADSLKAVNDIMGHEAGDELLKAIGKALGKHATRAFHTSGDEFIVEGSTREEVEEQLRKAKEYLAAAEIEATAPDGTTYKYKGLEISYGIGPNLKEADEAMAANKREREEQGLRAPRGERPKGMAAIPAPGVQPEGEASAGEEPKKLPANWLDAGWKIEQRGVLQIAISPEGKEYTLWGQRLEPIKEPLKTAIPKKPSKPVEPEEEKFQVPKEELSESAGEEEEGEKEAKVTEKEDTYKGISIYKPVRDLTDEEFEKIIAPAGEGMERKNEQLAFYERDPRFNVHVKPEERGYQPNLPEEKQPFKTDWHTVREYIKSGKLPERAEKLEKISARLMELDPKFEAGGSLKSAHGILLAIETGYYNNFLHPGNSNSRKVFAELTGQKLPAGVSNTNKFFQGKSFPADFAKIERTGREIRTAPPNLPHRLSMAEKKELKFSEFRKVSEDYYIQILGKEIRELEKVEGKPVKIPGHENFDFFLRKSGEGKFVLSEGITGASISSANTEKEAITSARENLKKRDPKALEDAIVRTGRDYGITPRYRIEKEGTKEAPAEKAPEPNSEGPRFRKGDIVKVTGESGLNVGWGGEVTLVEEVEGKQLVSVAGRPLRRSTDFELVRPEETVKASVIESPDLEYKRFIEGLSEREKQKASGLVVPNPRNPLAQIRAIKRELEKTEKEKPEAPPPENAEEEGTPQSIPFEAVKFANGLKNKLKKNYAWAYLKWKSGKTEEKPEPKGLSPLAAQIVRMSIDKILGEPYKFKPIAETAKAEGGKTHETGAGGENEPRSLVPGPAGVGEGEQPEAGRETHPKSPEAEGVSQPEGVPGEHAGPETRPGGHGRPGGRGPGVRGDNQPAGTGKPAGAAPLPGSRKEDRRLGGEHVRPRPERVEDRNHAISPEDTLVPGGKISRIKSNVAAIELAKSLEREKRNPTPEEKKILAQFTGWGALGKEAFTPADMLWRDSEKTGKITATGYSSYIPDDQKKDYEAWAERVGKKLHPELGGILSEEEWDEAKSSILNAFYTSREVIENGLWPIIQRLGFKGGTVLEPSAGVGHILGLMPRDIAENSRIMAVEKDKITGLILGKLYPEAKTFVKGFEEASQLHDNSVDLVVSNFPFGDFKVYDPKHKDYSGFNIHNYFFARSIAALKPGGLLVAITSHYTADAAGTEVRKYLARKADLVGGLRLPATAFEKSAGTEVTTDILVFRKKDSAKFDGKPFIDTVPVTADKDKTAYVNEYFANNPEMVLGEHSMTGTMYGGKEEYTLLPRPGKPLGELLAEKVGNLPQNIAGEGAVETESAPPPTIFADEGTKEGLLVEKDGKVYANEGGHLVTPIFGAGAQKTEAARKYIAVRTALKDLITRELSEASTEKEIEDQRKRLNRLYDAFVAKHGAISAPENKWLKEDAEFSLMLSLESKDPKARDWVFRKAPIFSGRTNFPFKEPTTAASPEDAIKISLTYRNRIDLPYVAKLLNAEKEAVKENLIRNRLAYLNPETGILESPDEYLSGNVREKLARAGEAVKDNHLYDNNVEDLKKIQPEKLGINQIHFRLGSPWIPTEAVENFISEFLDFKDAKVGYVRATDSSRFTLTTGRWAAATPKITNVWGVEGANALDLILDSLNLRFTSVFDTERDEKGGTRQVFNPQKSAAARDMQKRIQEEFTKWVKGHEKWGQELADIYNRDFNNTVLKKFSVPDIDYYPNASHEIKLRDHQKKSISRNLQESNVVAHAVGTGKTFIFATSAMEMRRLGTARKPLIVVQNSTVHQYAKAFRQLYPTANILIPNKRQLAAENRKRLISQVVTGNWDAVIIPHSVFDMMSVNPEKEAAFIREQVGELEKIIGEMREEGEDKRNIRQIEKLKEKKEVKLRKLLDTKKEDLLYFDQLGFDALLIDEAHRYKRSEFFTKMQNIKGIDRASASRSALLLLKAREVRERTSGKNVILATGTPISNTIAEAWTILRYVRPDLLEQFGARDFDSFAANFGEVVRDTEETASGDFKVVERFARYVNGPELLKMWRTAADIVLPEDVEVKRPKIKSGKPVDLQLDRPEELARFIQWIKARREAWDKLPGKEKRQNSHVPLVLFGLAKKAAIDLRLVSPKMPDLPGSKVNRSVEEVFRRWKESGDTRGTQVLFSDTFQSTDKSFNLFKDIKKKLVDKGIPANEIAIIHDFGSDEKREELFDRVNAGEVRIVMGTTEKLGVGVNIQDRLIAAHHIDVPNRPMDFEQRNGRIWRPGNLNEEIEILVYGVKNTLDSTGFQRLLIKQKFINQLMRGDITDRSFDDPFDPTQASFQDMMAAFGNPKVREKFGLENQIRDLMTLKDSHEKEIARANEGIARARSQIRQAKGTLGYWEAVSKELSEAFPEEKVTSISLDIDGKLTPLKREDFVAAVDGKVEDFASKIQETIKERFNTSREMFAALEPVEKEFGNVRGKINGIPIEIDLRPKVHWEAGEKERYGLAGVEILYELKTRTKNPDFLRLTRTVNTASGILISVPNLAGNTQKMPGEVRKEIARAENTIRTLEPLLNQPFAREAELSEKRKRLAEVEGELRAAESETEATKEAREQAEKERLRLLEAEFSEVSGRLEREKPEIEEAAETPGERIEKAEEGSEGEKGTPSFKLEGPIVPPFYSALWRTIEQKMGGSMPVKQLRALLKQPGIKQEEVKWSGIDEFLGEKEGKITKQEVLDFLDANRIEIREVAKEGSRRARGDIGGQDVFEGMEDEEILALTGGEIETKDETKFSKWQIPGGENYRELLFRLPTMAERSRIEQGENGLWYIVSPDGGKGGGFATREAAEKLNATVIRRRNEGGYSYTEKTFRSPHWSEPNILAHVRFNERIGTTTKKVGEFGRIDKEERVLFIEEIQSDWHQEGRKKGYNRPDLTELPEGYKITERGTGVSGVDRHGNRFEGKMFKVFAPDGHVVASGVTKENAVKAALRELRAGRTTGIPPAPFSKTWHEFVLKRMIRWAAENGFDRIAWTTGEQQADRYNLSKAVNRIEWEKTEPDEEKGIVALSIAPRDVSPEELYREIGKRTGLHWDTDPDAGPLLYAPADRLEDIVGKDLAKRILEDPADMGSFEGESLKIGGEGMKGFYDKIVPDFLNKFGKKWGAKVEETEIETGIMPGDAENDLPLVESEDPLQLLPDTVLRSVPSFPIPESMRESALTEGFPLFMPERSSWSDRTARVVPHSTIEKLKSHPDYQAAKAGDRVAGLRVARDLMKPEKISELKESLAKEKQVIIIAPVRMREAGLDNAIPPLMAEVISNRTGWQVDTSIIQINDVAHTDKGAIDRLFAQAEFEGDVVPGATYVILDDVVTTGGTLANLKGFIESKGGRVKAIQTIGAAQFATNLKIMSATLKKLREIYGQNLKETLEFVYGGPIHEKNLTESEARTFIHNQAEILERRRKARDEGQGRQGFSLGQGRAPQRTLRPKELTSPKGWEKIEGGKESGLKIRQEELSNIAALVEKIAHSRVFFPENIPIDLRDPANQAGLKKHGYTDEEIALYISEGYTAHNVGGRMTPVLVSPAKWQAIISVAVQGKTAWQVKSTALHEAFEAVRDFMLTEEEKKILDRKMPGWGKISSSEIQAEAFADYVMGKKGRLVPRSVQTVFDRINAFFERLANYLHGLGYKSAEDIFHEAKTGEVRERYLREPARLSSEGEQAPAFKLEGTISKFIDTLKSPDFPARAGQDKGFKEMVRKNRLGLVKVTDNDLKLWERALSLPFWLQDKYPELRPLVHTQMKREESRSEIIHGLLTRARPFFDLKGEEMAKAEKALIEGDRGGKVYTDEELKNKFNLSPEGVAGYRAVRSTLDWIHREWKAKIEENILREYEKEKWFALFKAAHGLDFSEDETLRLGKALKKTYKATEKPIETVKEHLQKIFEEKLTQEDKRLLVKDYVEAYNKARHQLDQVKRIVREAIGEGMSEEELNKNTRELVQAYIRSYPSIQQLKEMRDELNRIRGYFPRSRKQGKYRVVVLDEVEYPSGEKEKYTVFYQNASNRIEATGLYNKIKADPEYKDFEIFIEPNRQEGETTFMGASAINMQRLVDNAIEKLKTQGEVDPGTANLIRLNVLETLADDLKARGAGRFAIKRAGTIIEGYQKTNLKEVLKDYIDGWSGMITKQEAALEFLEELKEIPRNKPQLMAYASKYAQDMLRNQEPMDRISAKMRSLAFIYFLGGSMRAALVNFTQNYVTGIPFLAREVGAKSLKAEKLYHKAMFDVATGKNISKIEQRMLDEMINKGVAEDQFIRQINREVKGAVGQATGKVVDILSKPFSWMEKLNRKSAALTMFRGKYRAYSSIGSYSSDEAFQKAFADAQDFVYKTHYLMTKANLPSITAGGDIGAQFLKTAYTFRRFTHNYLLSLHHSLKGEDGRLALDVMARSLAYVVLLAGLPAVPFLDDLLDEWEKFFGTPVRSNMRKTLREAGGPVLEKLGMAGMPALMGIDISGSLKIGVPLAGSGTPQDTIYGVYGGLARKSLNAMGAVEREDYLRALEFASPAFIEAILKAYRMSETGVTTPRGKVITDEQGKPIRLGADEGIAQAAGFRPERLARISGEHWTMDNVQKHFKEKRNDLYSRYRLARTPEARRSVIRDMQKFNMEARKYRGVIPPITATSIGQATQQKPEKSFMGFGRTMETNP